MARVLGEYGPVTLLRIIKSSWLGFVLFCWTTSLVNAAFDGFEVSDGYASNPNQTLIGLPTGASDIFSGPWQNNSNVPNPRDKNFQSSNGPDHRGYQGDRTFELKRGKTDGGGFIEAVRPMAPYSGGLANPIQQVEVYAFIPAKTKNDPNSTVGMYLYSGSFKLNESASITARASSTLPNAASWWVWDAGTYVDTGVEVRADAWVHLTMEVNLATKTYTASVDGSQVTPTRTLRFGTVNVSDNLTGVAFGMNNTGPANRSAFFDALTVRPRVPELQSWLTVLGMVGAGLLPFSLRTRR